MFGQDLRQHFYKNALNYKPMKLKILSLIAGFAFMVSCGPSYEITNPDGTTVVNVPSGMVTTFNSQYPGATRVVWATYDPVVVPIDWELTDWPVLTSNDYVVTFVQDNSEYYAYYDENGEWIGTAMVMTDHATLPTTVTSMISADYPGYTIATVQKEFRGDRIAYEIQLKNGDSKMKLLVDANGNVIKKKVKTQ
jgi:hypothetical protein